MMVWDAAIKNTLNKICRIIELHNRTSNPNKTILYRLDTPGAPRPGVAF